MQLISAPESTKAKKTSPLESEIVHNFTTMGNAQYALAHLLLWIDNMCLVHCYYIGVHCYYIHDIGAHCVPADLLPAQPGIPPAAVCWDWACVVSQTLSLDVAKMSTAITLQLTLGPKSWSWGLGIRNLRGWWGGNGMCRGSKLRKFCC